MIRSTSSLVVTVEVPFCSRQHPFSVKPCLPCPNQAHCLRVRPFHYHFVCERILSSEVELVDVPTDRKTADIFTKPLDKDNLQHLFSMLGLQLLDMPNLSNRSAFGKDEKEGDDVWKVKFNEEFYLGTFEEVGISESAEEAKDLWTDEGRAAKQRLARYRGRDWKRESKPGQPNQGVVEP